MNSENFKSKTGIDSWIYSNLLKGARNLKFFEAGANDRNDRFNYICI